MYLLVSMQILLASTAVLLPQDKHDLKRLLTAAEWRTLVGEDDTGLDLDVVVPQFPLQDRQRRSSDFRKFMYINAPNLLQNFQLDLTLTQNLLDPNFVMLNRWENRTDILPSNLVDMECYYRSEGLHRAALSVCGGVRGIITSQHDEYFIINPFPQRFHKRSTQYPHLIVRKNFTNENKSFNLVSKTAPSSDINITMKNAHNFNLFNNFRSDLFNLRDSNKSLDSFKNKYNCGNTHFESREQEGVINRSARSNRIPRSYSSSDSPVYVETAVFVDRDLYQHMSLNFPTDTEQEVVRFVLAMVNAVQLLYHDQSLGRPVSFVMKRLEILHTDPGGLRRSHDIDRFLGNFCAWQGDENPPNDSDPLHWDHALILTGLDLYVLSKNGKVSSQVVGLAPVAGMCTATSSCTVNEGRHFESAYVVAHEIGHNLGMRHDGPLADNNCDPGSYIMSPTLGSGKITWSSCSKRYLQEFLMTPQSHCLMDHIASAGQIDHNENGALPGERFNANQQCMLKYGPGSHHAMSQPLHDLCRDLHCRRERYTWTSHPALEGTTCGTNKWCRSGRCVPRGLSAIQADEAIHGGWSAWGHFSDCASACLHVEGGGLGAGSTGVMVAARRCNNPRPENGGEPCVGSDHKYRTCVANQCENVPHTTIRDFADEVCLRAREVDSELVGTGLQKMSVDAEEACTIWCYKRNGGYKSRGWTFPDGTTCKTQQSQASEFCISGVCQDFSCERGNGEDGPFKLSNEMCLFSREKRREVAFGFWVAASDCFFNCISPGSGIRVVEKQPCRHCNSSASIQLCKLENPVCGKIQSTLEFATSVCTKYSERVRRLSGLGMQLSPSLEDPDRACRIACQDENVLHRFYLVNGEDGWFPFGSDCSRGDTTKKAFCIRGKCLEFGSDDTPLHESEYTLHSADTKKLYKGDSRRRRRRTLEQQPTTVTMMLDDQTLKQIIATINNSDISTKIKKHLIEEFPIDLENPVFAQTTDWKWLSYRQNGVDANSFL